MVETLRENVAGDLQLRLKGFEAAHPEETLSQDEEGPRIGKHVEGSEHRRYAAGKRGLH